VRLLTYRGNAFALGLPGNRLNLQICPDERREFSLSNRTNRCYLLQCLQSIAEHPALPRGTLPLHVGT